MAKKLKFKLPKLKPPHKVFNPLKPPIPKMPGGGKIQFPKFPDMPGLPKLPGFGGGNSGVSGGLSKFTTFIVVIIILFFSLAFYKAYKS